MENTENKRLTEIKSQMVENIDKHNQALCKGDLKAMNELDVALKQLEVDYQNEMAKVVYNECLATENPMKTAITRYSYNVLSHKDNKEDGIVVERVLKEDRTRQIDLLKFCKYSQDIKAPNKLDTGWQYPIMKLNQLLCMRSAKELKFTQAQVKQIAKTFYMEEVARKLDMGETPDSNTQICKLVQQCVDQILFEDDGKGKNVYKVNNHDVAYLLMLYTKKGKSALAVQVAKHDFLRRLIGDVMFRILTDGKYSLEYKEMKIKK